MAWYWWVVLTSLIYFSIGGVIFFLILLLGGGTVQTKGFFNSLTGIFLLWPLHLVIVIYDFLRGL